jgi:hypothetical protein
MTGSKVQGGGLPAGGQKEFSDNLPGRQPEKRVQVQRQGLFFALPTK